MIKKTDKLPRGSFFYIQVGERFYGGRKSEMQTVNDVTGMYEVRPGYMKPKGRSSDYWNYAGGADWWRQREADDALKSPNRKRDIYNIHKTTKVPQRGKVTLPTGRTTPELVDVIKDAKKFRRKIQAETIGQELERYYSGLNLKVTIELHEENGHESRN